MHLCPARLQIASGGYVAPPSTNSTTPGATPPTGGGPAASLASGGPAGAASTVSPTVTTPSESGGAFFDLILLGQSNTVDHPLTRFPFVRSVGASGGGVLSTAPSASGTVGSAGQISSACVPSLSGSDVGSSSNKQGRIELILPASSAPRHPTDRSPLRILRS